MTAADDLTRLRLAHAGRDVATFADGDPASVALVGRVLTSSPVRGKFVRIQPVTVTGTATEGGTGTLTNQGSVIVAEVWCDRAPVLNDLVVAWHLGYRWVVCDDRAPSGSGGTPWKLCAQIQACSGISTIGLNGCTVRFQGPGGVDTTVNLDTATSLACYDNPATGTWTITVSHAGYTTQTVTQAVTSGTSVTKTVTLVLSYTTIHYSDDYGSFSALLTNFCFVNKSYNYTSNDSNATVTCSGTPLCVRHQTSTIDVHFTLLFGPDSTGANLYVTIQRTVNIQNTAQDDCAAAITGGTTWYVTNSGDACGSVGCRKVKTITFSIAAPTGTAAVDQEDGASCLGAPESLVTATVSFS